MLTKKILALILLVFLSGVLFYAGLGKVSLWDIDEPNNAECAREMMLRHDPIVPTFNWELRTDKPVLIYWCMWASYKLFGVNEFAARFTSPLFGITTVILVFLAGNALLGWPVGFWAGLILSVTLFFNVSVRIATPDAALIFFINLAIFSFLLGYEKRRAIFFYLFYLAMGLAVLAKGPMGIVLPVGTICLFLLIKRDIAVLKEIKVWQGLILFTLIVLPWYLLVGLKTDGAFLKGFLLKHNIHRFLSPMEGHKGPFFFYLLVLPFAFFPWGGFLPYLLWAGHKSRVENSITNTEIFLWLWLVLFIGFFSLARTKLPTYINPIYPALAVLTAFYLQNLPRWAERCLLHFNAFFGLLLLLGGGAALVYFYPRLAWVALFGLILLLFWQIGLYFSRQNKKNWVVLSQFIAAYIFTLAVVFLGTPAIDQYKLTKPFALEIKSKLTPNTTIIAYHYFQPSLVFYTQHKVLKTDNPQTVKDIVNQPEQTFIIGRQSPLQALKTQLPNLQFLQCRPGFYVRDVICLGYVRTQKP